MKYHYSESPLLPPKSHKITGHPDPASAGEGSPSSQQELKKDVHKD